MDNNTRSNQGVVWVFLIIAIVALVALWISKNPAAPSSTTKDSTESAQPTTTIQTTPTPTKSLQEIESALKELNSSATDIDNGINDTQLDINL